MIRAEEPQNQEHQVIGYIDHRYIDHMPINKLSVEHDKIIIRHTKLKSKEKEMKIPKQLNTYDNHHLTLINNKIVKNDFNFKCYCSRRAHCIEQTPFTIAD